MPVLAKNNPISTVAQIAMDSQYEYRRYVPAIIYYVDLHILFETLIFLQIFEFTQTITVMVQNLRFENRALDIFLTNFDVKILVVICNGSFCANFY